MSGKGRPFQRNHRHVLGEIDEQVNVLLNDCEQKYFRLPLGVGWVVRGSGGPRHFNNLIPINSSTLAILPKRDRNWCEARAPGDTSFALFPLLPPVRSQPPVLVFD